jgi:ubiquinone/menaquinone biosynthesis C-methylase UbiE
MFGLVHHPAHYERFADRVAGRFYRRVVADVAAAGFVEGARVLDAGTGPGTLPLLLTAASPGLRIDAVDLAPEMVERGRRRATDRGATSVTFTVGDVGALPFDDATFDLVVSTASQHHWTDPVSGFRELARVLRPGAEAWVYDFRWVLRRAEVAALRMNPPGVVRVESPLSGASRLSPMGRVVVRRESRPSTP